MRKALLTLLLLAPAPLFAQTSDPTGRIDPDPTQTIVVTGIRLADYRTRLDACLARHCPVNEDVDATMALAEAQFLNGDYHDARITILGSLHRNHGQAAAFPEPVADLYRANARVARSLGMDDLAESSTLNILRALQRGIPQEDYRHFTARFEISEMLMRRSTANSARRATDELAELEQVARAAGREDVATVAELRRLSFLNIVYPNGTARAEIVRLAQLADPADRMRATGAKILLSRIYRDEGNRAGAETLLAEIGRAAAGSPRRALLDAPHYHLQYEITVTDGDTVQDLLDGLVPDHSLQRLGDNAERKWIDVGFWVLPNGHVSGLEIVRQGGPTGWADPLLGSIGGRLYSTGPEATYRLERYTYTEPLMRVAATRIPQRSRAARVEYLDLTTNNMPPPGSAPETLPRPSVTS